MYHQIVIKHRKRDEIANHLAKNEIETMIHYPIPIHKQKQFLLMGKREYFPQAERAAREVISLPVHPYLTKRDLDDIIKAIKEPLA